MAELLEISGIDYSQGLPTEDGAGNLGQESQAGTWPLWILCGLGAIVAGAAIYLICRSRRD